MSNRLQDAHDVHVDDSQRAIESYAIYASLIAAFVGFAFGVIAFWGADVPLFLRGEISLGFVATVLSSAVALITYLFVAYKNAKRTDRAHGIWAHVRYRVDTWSLALTHGLLAFLVVALGFYIISQSFLDARIDVWGASVILGISTALAAYVTYLSAATMTALRVSMLLALFLVSGTLISMLTASNPLWWDDHFSSLGAGGGLSGYAFNATLIITGLVIVALSRYIADDFEALTVGGKLSRKSKVRAIQFILAAIGICLAFVGLFVYNAYPFLHNNAAAGMAVLFIALIVGLPLLARGFSRAFYVASYALLTALLVSVWLFSSVGYFNLTVFELVAAAIIFTWLVIFVRHIAVMRGEILER